MWKSMPSIRSESRAIASALHKNDETKALDILRNSSHKLKAVIVKNFDPQLDLHLLRSGTIKIHVKDLHSLSDEQLELLEPKFVVYPSLGWRISNEDITVLDVNPSLSTCFSMLIDEHSVVDAIKLHTSGVRVKHKLFSSISELDWTTIVEYLRAFSAIGIVFNHIDIRRRSLTITQLAELLDLGYSFQRVNISSYDSVEGYVRCLPYLTLTQVIQGMLITGHVDDVELIPRRKLGFHINNIKELETIASNPHLQVKGPYVFDTTGPMFDNYRELIDRLTA